MQKTFAADKLSFSCGLSMKNRFMLAPMTNCQSHEDGTLSEDEFHWLRMRARGGFGLTMTCASHVCRTGQGFPGQLGIFSDRHIGGHRRLAEAIRAEASLSVVQLHHAGMRAPRELIEQDPLCPSPDEKTGARAMTLTEVGELRENFINAAVRAKKSGHDGVEIHGAHGYILCQFLSSKYNRRNDLYGGTLENRARLVFEILAGVRESCGPDFLLGIRISPERFGMLLSESLILVRWLIDSGLIDFIDVSLWDCFKLPVESDFADKILLDHFAGMERGEVKMTVAGKISGSEDVARVLDSGIDFVSIGRSAILHHDFPKKVLSNPVFLPASLPVTAAHLSKEGLSPSFITYMRRWKGFVEEQSAGFSKP